MGRNKILFVTQENIIKDKKGTSVLPYLLWRQVSLQGDVTGMHVQYNLVTTDHHSDHDFSLTAKNYCEQSKYCMLQTLRESWVGSVITRVRSSQLLKTKQEN